jgi:HSP20 family molecular chaperone IbpA
LDGKKNREPLNISDILNFRVLGIDFGELIKEWTGVTDIRSLMEMPEKLEQVKERIEKQKDKLQEVQKQLRKKYGDAVRFDYDIRVGGLMGGSEGIRIGGGEFFQRLDELARERAKWRTVRRKVKIPKGEVREPLVDISERKDHIYITAELPGIEKQDIKLNVTDHKITISADTPNRKYHTEVTLPTRVAPSPIDQSYKNGVLEAKFKKKDE